MTPTPKRANSKKKIRESLSLVVNAIIPLEARAPKRVLNSFGKRAFVSLFSLAFLSRARALSKDHGTTTRTRKTRQLPSLFVQKCPKPLLKADICKTDETDDALGRGYKGIRSMRGAHSSTIRRRLLRATKESALLSRVLRARVFKEREERTRLEYFSFCLDIKP